MTEMPHICDAVADSYDSTPPDFTPHLAMADSVVASSRLALVAALLCNERSAALQPRTSAVVVVNRAGIVLCESAAALDLLSFKTGDLMGGRFFRFIHDDDVAQVYAAFLNVAEGFTNEVSVDFRHRMGDGAFLQLNAVALRLGNDVSPLVVFRLIPETPESFSL